MSTVFLVIFLVGFGLTAISALLGGLHLGGDAGHDFGHGHGGHVGPGHGHGGHVDLGHSHAGHVSTGHGHGHGGDAEAASVSAVNYQTLVAFLMGFGGVGYIVSRVPLVGWLLAIPVAAVGGVASAFLIFKFLRFLVRGERVLPPTSYVGVVGRLNMPIREGGTGELVYMQNDVRQVSAARSADGKAIGKGEEVVILRYDRGVAYVQLWQEFMAETDK
ncbi:MAG TPA: hypothetical protein VGK74_20685 [Symbiobacteriaceae bacterium]|jgi:membrane protein implicated in regulation of membrane protease activity